jgi:hypothetical protein
MGMNLRYTPHAQFRPCEAVRSCGTLITVDPVSVLGLTTTRETGPLPCTCLPLATMKNNVLLLSLVCFCFSHPVPAGLIPYRALVLSDNPVVYYEFDETSGTTAFNSAATGALYDGTFNTAGGSVTINQPSFAQGGRAYDFGGGFIGAASALVNSLDEWTVEAWVNYDAAKTGASNFLSNDQGGWNDDVLFGIGPETGTFGVPAGSVGLIQQGNPGTTRDFAGSPLPAGEWHHVVVTGSTGAGALTLYIDGVLAASDTSLVNGITFNGADGFGTANLTIGAARPNAGDAGYRPYDGLLDEVAIYDSVLTPAEINAHATIPEPGSGLLFLLGGLMLIRRRRQVLGIKS